jgi:hypothetical protein
MSVAFGASIGAYGSCGSIWKSSNVDSFNVNVYNTTVFGFIQSPPGLSSNINVISVRGTHGFTQLESEFKNIALKPKIGFELKNVADKFLVQDYFAKAADLLWNEMSAKIKSRSLGKVLVTGHSLGGAVADLLALRIITELGISPTVFTFGCPRVGDYDFSKVYDSLLNDSWRVVHYNDIVPHLPACEHSLLDISNCKPESGANFHHGKEVFFQMNDGMYKYDKMDASAEISLNSFKICTANEDKSCADGISSNLGLGYSINQHIQYFGLPLGDTGRSACNDTAALL